MTLKSAQSFRRMLVIDTVASSSKMLAELLRSLIPNCQVYGAQTQARALKFCESFDPQIIFVDFKGPELDGPGFTRQLRRGVFACREAPVIMVTAEATAAAIIGARDSGVHEFLRRPYTLGDLEKRIDAVTSRPRDWIEAISYIGPDRRRFNSADYKGPRKRRADGVSPAAQRIGQAIRIVQSASAALESDPTQALRALRAQARSLAEISTGQEKLAPLNRAALGLESYLLGPGLTQGLSREQIDTFAAQLIAAAPAEAQRAA